MAKTISKKKPKTPALGSAAGITVYQIPKGIPFGGAGPHTPVFIKNTKLINSLIRKWGLLPSKLSSYYSGPQVAGQKLAPGTEASIHFPNFPGPLKVPHLHYEGDVYILNDSQWKEFSTAIIKGFQDKLANAKSVNFGQLMEMSGAIDTLA